MRTPARLLAIPVFAGLLLVACGDDDATTVSGTPTSAVASATAPPTSGGEQPAASEVKEITVKVGLDTGPDRVEDIRVGQQVVITMQSDQDEDYHLHGYELSQRAAAGVEAAFTFTADQPGAFELESHVTDEVLLVLMVQ